MHGLCSNCCWEGYGFKAVYPGIAYINERVWDYSRVSFSRKLISQLKILVQSSLKLGISLKNIKK